ncbi:pyridoxamine 5'-phosphate oxidase family protein [Sphingomonas alpina]|uniref:Pyridoxamine 5'-phosphate oxidase family protein n=1 Tax=Sphingomonas alpina TaxID=653931 RepID=A0A7H0LQE4_9SPHN|nr:pyridoxamine 5'-phosphate oxidase family protein [Sphingomonas alpina]
MVSIAFVQSEQQLRDLYGAPDTLALRKVLDHLDVHCRNFISASPFFMLATHDRDGHSDASPRGDQPGFVEILDDRHLLLPDKPGNNRIDSLINVFHSPSIGMLFLIPGVRETLRINGEARITCDPSLLLKHEEGGKVPKTGLVIEVREAFLHCARSVMRAKIWVPETWPDRKVVPSAGRIWSDHIALSSAAEQGEVQ